MIAVVVANASVTFYAGHLVWVPTTLFVALVLGMVAYTATALWTMFSEQTEADDVIEEDDDEPCLPDGTPLFPSRKLTRSERQQGMADRGCDTLEEARSER